MDWKSIETAPGDGSHVRPSSCTLDAFVGGPVHLAYYHTGFTDDPPVLLDVCESATAADEAINVHKEQRDRECEYEDAATWWTETRDIRTANAQISGGTPSAESPC